MCADVVISPATTTSPVVTSVSQATRPFGSWRITSSSTASEIWSAILSGWPSVTDSEVNRKFLFASLKTAPIVWSSSLQAGAQCTLRPECTLETQTTSFQGYHPKTVESTY